MMAEPLLHGLFVASLVSIALVAIVAMIADHPSVDATLRQNAWSAAVLIPIIACALAVARPIELRLPSTNASATAAPAQSQAVTATQMTTSQPEGRTLRTLEWLDGPTSGGANSSFAAAMVIAWLAGLCVAVFRLLRGVISAHCIRETAQAVDDSVLAALASSACATVRVHDTVAVPIAIGLHGRAVILPRRVVSGLSAAECTIIVKHELAHLRRHDDWRQLVEAMSLAFLWFLPTAHFAVRRAERSREAACDATVVAGGVERLTYARALWHCAAGIENTRFCAMPAVNGGRLVARIEALVAPVPHSRVRSRFIAAALVAAITITTLAAAAKLYHAGRLTSTGSMHVRRASFVAVRLLDGTVLVAGGLVRNGEVSSEGELYDPTRGSFTRTGALGMARSSPAAVRLRDGKVLVAGGWTSGGPTETAELYDPKELTFKTISPMSLPRAGATATLLRDGTVLVTGGEVSEGSFTATAEVFDPRAGHFNRIGSMNVARTAHTATALADGRVFIAGGLDGRESLRSTEIYNPADRGFLAGPALREPRSKHGAAMLGDGTVLVVGGSRDYGWSERLKSAERVNLAGGKTSAVGSMHAVRFKVAEATIPLPDGRVLVAGGDSRAEVFDPGTNRFAVVPGNLGSARNLGAAVSLGNGTALIAGGYDSLDPLPTTETALVYHP